MDVSKQDIMCMVFKRQDHGRHESACVHDQVVTRQCGVCMPTRLCVVILFIPHNLFDREANSTAGSY